MSTHDSTHSTGRNDGVTRRDFYGIGSNLLGAIMTFVLAVPGVAYLVDPLRRKAKAGDFRPLARLSDLEVGVPRQFPIIDERQDAWVKYPPQPIGAVWLIRQKDGANPPVVAFTAECPHLGCAINLVPDRGSFLCPCHTSAFTLEGKPINKIPPRGMDTLEVAALEGDNPEIRVKFERFQTQREEKLPLV